MIIEKKSIGAYGKKTVYAVCTEPAENGDKTPHTIARFDTLKTASIVFRYLTGCNMSDADETAAKEAIKKADAPTDESKRTRKAS